MELRLIHFYPDLMSLYGSYANVSVLKRLLERLGNAVAVESVRPGEGVSLSGADFLFMGAGTERSARAAMEDFARFSPAVRSAAGDGLPMLFAGTAMELLGASVTEADGTVYPGAGLAEFSTVHGKTRLVGDVYGHTALYPEAVVGFMNKCGIIQGVSTPLLTDLTLGFGNDGPHTPEGFLQNRVFASELTGPILVKNPKMLEAAAAAVYAHRGAELPAELPADAWAAAGYAVTEEQLRLRCGKQEST